MDLYALLLQLALLQLKMSRTYSGNDSRGTMMTPVIDVRAKINLVEKEKIRCEAHSGNFCLFYKDLSEVAFRKVEYNSRYNVCQFEISAKELVGEMGLKPETEVFLSCAVGLNATGGSRVSQRSEKKKMVVTDPFVVGISAERRDISAEESTRVRCEAQRGSRCRFYTDRSESPLRTEEFRSRACMVSLTGKEILAKSVPHSEGTEVLLSCDVELEKDREEVISSGRSKGVNVIVFGVIHAPTTDVLNNNNANKGDRGVLLWAVAGGLLVLMAAGGLIVACLKRETCLSNNGRTEAQATDTMQLYSVISRFPSCRSQKHQQGEQKEPEACYKSIVQSSTWEEDYNPKDDYADVVYPSSWNLSATPPMEHGGEDDFHFRAAPQTLGEVAFTDPSATEELCLDYK
ncbi:hypothetical protein GN956_G23462 [Arapaima gigas]